MVQSGSSPVLRLPQIGQPTPRLSTSHIARIRYFKSWRKLGPLTACIVSTMTIQQREILVSKFQINRKIRHHQFRNRTEKCFL